MAEVTVKQLAEVVGTPVDRLLEQFGEAGIGKSGPDDAVSDEEKVRLLEHLRTSRAPASTTTGDGGGGGSRITLRRKRTSELKVGGAGRKSVNVEVRGRRTYVKRSVAAEDDNERAKALEAERLRQEEELRELEEKRLQAEREREEAEEKARLEREEAQRQADEEKRQREEQEEAARKAAEAPPEPAPAEPASPPPQPAEGKDDRRRQRKRKPERKGERSERAPDELHVARDKSGRRRKKTQKTARAVPVQGQSRHGFEKPTQPVKRDIGIPETITVGELANKMAVKAPELIKILMKMGFMATINQTLDQETAILVVEEVGHNPLPQSDADVEEALAQDVIPELTSEPVARPPVVTVMGHVDHGKTSLLDYLRRTRVTAGEAGGITQHIGAYSVATPTGGTVTFLDTPGHAAFSAMRARGAQCTDIVVLVVAADDGVKPQTIEAIQHARAAGVPLVVAINKMDKDEADPDRVKNELVAQEVVPDEWGGDTIFAAVSALKGDGVDDLLESILLQAEVLELTAPAEGAARGIVVEATVEKGRGPVATLLVQAGELRKGDSLICGTEHGRVRAMFDEAGKSIKRAGPSRPAVILGLSGAPRAGDDFAVVDDERKARELADFRRDKSRDQRLAQRQAVTADDIFSQVREDQLQVVNVVIKSDVQGSFEALRDSLEKISGDEVRVKVIGGGVGGVNESDVNLALASNAFLVGFNVRADASARRTLDESEIDVRYYSVIYDVIDDVKAMVSGLLAPEIRERIIGLAEVKDVFRSPKFGQVAGCLVVDGVVRRSAPIRVLRDNVVIYEGELESLRRFKDNVNEVRMGTECGIGVRNYNDVRAGDQIEVFERTEHERTI
jgi:translation initiation factor IF-2